MNELSKTFLPSLYFSYFLYKIANFQFEDTRHILVLTSILHSFVLIFFVTVLILVIVNGRRKLIFY